MFVAVGIAITVIPDVILIRILKLAAVIRLHVGVLDNAIVVVIVPICRLVRPPAALALRMDWQDGEEQGSKKSARGEK
jgi:hypothetical protein